MTKLICILAIFSNIAFAQDLKLEDLGFKKETLKVDLQEQKSLETRSSMLSTHQILGLSALALMAATYLTAEEGAINPAEGKTQLGATDTHKYLGIAAGLTYFTAAGFSIFAPEPKNEKESTGSTKWHKRLAYIHFPAMVLTTILGLMADKQFKDGKTPSGLVAQKPLVANVAFLSMLAAGITMTFNF